MLLSVKLSVMYLSKNVVSPVSVAAVSKMSLQAEIIVTSLNWRITIISQNNILATTYKILN